MRNGTTSEHVQLTLRSEHMKQRARYSKHLHHCAHVQLPTGDKQDWGVAYQINGMLDEQQYAPYLLCLFSIPVYAAW